MCGEFQRSLQQVTFFDTHASKFECLHRMSKTDFPEQCLWQVWNLECEAFGLEGYFCKLHYEMWIRL